MARSAAGDVRAGVVSAWPTVSAAALNAAIPAANLYAGGLPAKPTPPYAQVLAVPEGEPEFTQPVAQGSPYVQRVALTVKVWAAGTAAVAASDAVSSLAALVLAAFGNEAWTIADTRLLASLPQEPAEVEDGLYNGEPVWRADVVFKLTLQRAVK